MTPLRFLAYCLAYATGAVFVANRLQRWSDWYDAEVCRWANETGDDA